MKSSYYAALLLKFVLLITLKDSIYSIGFEWLLAVVAGIWVTALVFNGACIVFGTYILDKAGVNDFGAQLTWDVMDSWDRTKAFVKLLGTPWYVMMMMPLVSTIIFLVVFLIHFL